MNTEKVEERKEAQGEHLIVTKPEDASIYYADSVQANWNPDRVVLAFTQNNIINITSAGSAKQNFSGRLVAQIAITWPHLARLRDLLDRIIGENKEAVIDAVTEAFSGASAGGEQNERD